MNKNKLFYSSPSAKLLVIRFEGNIMSAGQPGGNDTVIDDDNDY